MPNPTIYCTNCRFFETDDSGLEYGRCGHQKAKREPEGKRFIAPEFDNEPTQRYAQTMRGEFADCGPGAKLFEPKHPEAVAA